MSKATFQSILESLRYPIWQAPIGSLAGPELASAVSSVGGMGSMALTWTDPEIAVEQVRQVQSQTENPFQVNFALAFPPTSLDACLDAGAPIVTFSWGDPEPFLPRVRAAGSLVGIQVTNVAGVRRSVDIGADFLICQGVEAGGHVQSSTPLADLLPRIIEAANGVPVIAAGGLSRGRDIGQILAIGAQGAMLGTRFVATQESRAHDDYKRYLVESTGETALTFCFDGDWPYSAHRILRNSTFERWESSGCPKNGARPGEGDIVAETIEGEAIFRYDSASPKQGYVGNIEAMCLYAGAGTGAIHDIPPAGQLVEWLWREYVSDSPGLP